MAQSSCADDDAPGGWHDRRVGLAGASRPVPAKDPRRQCLPRGVWLCRRGGAPSSEVADNACSARSGGSSRKACGRKSSWWKGIAGRVAVRKVVMRECQTGVVVSRSVRMLKRWLWHSSHQSPPCCVATGSDTGSGWTGCRSLTLSFFLSFLLWRRATTQQLRILTPCSFLFC